MVPRRGASNAWWQDAMPFTLSSNFNQLLPPGIT
jgi:hypothetical protein